MRTQTAVVSLLVGGALLCLSSEAWASAVRSREARGDVQTMDSTNRVLTLKLDQRQESLAVKWTRQTQFFRNWKCDGADALKPGTRARIYYRSPFFGKPFATKVVWEDEKK